MKVEHLEVELGEEAGGMFDGELGTELAMQR